MTFLDRVVWAATSLPAMAVYLAVIVAVCEYRDARDAARDRHPTSLVHQAGDEPTEVAS